MTENAIIHDQGPEEDITDPDHLLDVLQEMLGTEPEWKGHLGTWIHPAMIIQIQMPTAEQPHCWFRFVIPDEMSIELKVHEHHAEMLAQWLEAIKEAVKG